MTTDPDPRPIDAPPLADPVARPAQPPMDEDAAGMEGEAAT